MIFCKNRKAVIKLLQYALRERLISIIFAIGAFSLCLLWVFLVPPDFFLKPALDWNNWEPVLGITTLFVALSVWFGEIFQDWDNSLPKRMTVRFIHVNEDTGEEKVIMKCEEAYLAGESDIRAWGQQLGRQMANNELLNFETCIQEPPKRINGEYKLYNVTIPLTLLPKDYCVHYQKRHGEECVVDLKQRKTLVEFYSEDDVLAVHWKRESDVKMQHIIDWHKPDVSPPSLNNNCNR
jgi:hypothetical protein